MTPLNHERLRKIPGVGPKRAQNVLAKLEQLGKDQDDLFKMSPAEIKLIFHLPRNVAEAIANNSVQPKLTHETISDRNDSSEQLVAKGIKTLRRGSPDYPKRLETTLDDKAPPVLYVWGNLDLINKPAVGFCGSRDASQESIAATADTARQITEMSWVVVSGHARGVDTQAHLTALENGGSTIIVAAEGILNFKLRHDLKKIAKPEQILIISEFAPNARWSVANAMARNRTIIGLSDAMILVEARMEGGTFQAGETTLHLKKPLYVALYQKRGPNADGNSYFVEKGASALEKNPTTGGADIEHLKTRVINCLTELMKQSPDQKPEQLPLLI